MTRKQSIVAAVLLTTIVFGSLITCSILFPKPERIPFDVAGWNAPRSDSEGRFTGTRLKMVDDLLDRYDFHGWSAQEVQDLLGEPDHDHIEAQGHILKYDLRDGLKLLVFAVDDQNLVVDYHVHRDD